MTARQRAACGMAAVVIAFGLFGCGRKAVDLPDPAELANHVTIRRDTFGIPHILADSEEAAAFGFGFAQAEDHAAEIGRRYLAARGEAARHFGECRDCRRSGDGAVRQHGGRTAGGADDFSSVSADHFRLRRGSEPIRGGAPSGASVVDARDHSRRRPRVHPVERSRISGRPGASAAASREVRRSRPATQRGGRRLGRRARIQRAGARRLAHGDRQADPARQPAPAMGVALLGGARPCAWDDRLLRIDAARASRCFAPGSTTVSDSSRRTTPRTSTTCSHCGSIRSNPDHYLFDGESLPLPAPRRHRPGAEPRRYATVRKPHVLVLSPGRRSSTARRSARSR